MQYAINASFYALYITLRINLYITESAEVVKVSRCVNYMKSKMNDRIINMNTYSTPCVITFEPKERENIFLLFFILILS